MALPTCMCCGAFKTSVIYVGWCAGQPGTVHRYGESLQMYYQSVLKLEYLRRRLSTLFAVLFLKTPSEMRRHVTSTRVQQSCIAAHPSVHKIATFAS